MYLDFYNLKEKPFSLTPDPAFLYYSMAHKRAIAFLKYGLQESKGFLQLTGPVGSGKTTLLRAVLSTLDEKTKTAYIMNPSAPFPDLLRSIMKDLEIPNIPQSRIKTELLDFFHDYLLTQARRGNRVVVIFDEAQNLSIKNLEEIRMLSNFETTKDKLIQIIFVGQAELVEMLDRQDLRQLKQRIQVRYNLAALRLPEVKEYINHRLYIAGSNGEPKFSDEACEIIYRFSSGIPRLINSLCDVVLLIGYVSEKKHFDAEIAEEAIREISGSFADESAGVETISEPSLSEISEPGSAEVEDTAPPFGSRHLSDAGPEENAVDFFPQEEKHGSVGLEENREDAANRAADPPVAVNEELSEEDAGLTEDDAHEQEGEQKEEESEIASDNLPLPVEEKRGGVLSRTLLLLNRMTGRSKKVRHGPDGNCDGENGSLVAKRLGRFTGHLRLITFPIFRIRASLGRKGDVPAGFVNPKVMILLKENTVLKGIAANLDLNANEFSFMNIESQNGKNPDFVLFENIIAARLVDDLKEKWEPRTTGTSSQPRGRQIAVTLITGEVIEGITLDSFDSCCKRFFVVSPGSDGNPSWILVERTGSAGILTEHYSEGIYAEEYETFIGEGTDAVVVSSEVESKGDLFFGIHDFEAALKEYQREVGRPEHSERLQQKISLSRLNLGIKFLKENNYNECRIQLEKITNGHLPENILKRVTRIKEFIQTVTTEPDSLTKERNTDVKN